MRRTCAILALALAAAALAGCAKKSLITIPHFGPYTFVRSWGGIGTGNGQFYLPEDVAIGPNGRVYVTDSFNNRVQVFDEAGRYQFQWGDSGSAEGEFQFPYQLAIDASGNVYVADAENHRVQKFAADGTFLTQWGTPGSGDRQFADPLGIAIDATGNVYVADTQCRVQKFTANGTYLSQWGSPGDGDGQFNWPCSIAVDDSGYVYVVDHDWAGTWNERIEKFTADGQFVQRWGHWGRAPGEFEYPMDVTVDARGRVYVGDGGNDRVQEFTRNGVTVTTCYVQSEREDYGAFTSGIALRPDGGFYVAVRSNGRIQQFALTEGGAR